MFDKNLKKKSCLKNFYKPRWFLWLLSSKCSQNSKHEIRLSINLEINLSLQKTRSNGDVWSQFWGTTSIFKIISKLCNEWCNYNFSIFSIFVNLLHTSKILQFKCTPYL